MGRLLTVSLLLGVASAHPSNMECNDPRFDPGNMAMHVYAQPNQNDPAMSFTADTAKYTHGSSVKLSIDAKGDKYLNQPYGTFVAIRAYAVLGWEGDYGAFSGFTGGLNLTGKAWGKGSCLNTAISQTTTPFTGSASLTWTAGPQTYGDVVVTLMWGNGVGTDDPLAHIFPKMNTTHPFLYTRTMTLQGPPVPINPPPGSLLSASGGTKANKCQAPSTGYNLPHSPVFVQTLRTFPAKSITYPAGRCLQCREDFQGKCKSALVECPKEPGMLAVEHIYTSSPDCAGPRISTPLSTAYVHCPGPEYHSPWNVNLERFVGKLQRDHPMHFKDEATARSAIAEYRRMLYLIQQFPDAPVVPSKLVDLAWHEHILDTQVYKKDSQKMFGRYIHHAPSFGDDADAGVIKEKEGMLRDQAEMFKQYVQLFEDEPRRDVWPTAQGATGGRLPDCCKAQCVKPNCASCVGCNAVNCGKMEEEGILQMKKTKQPQAEKTLEVLPEHFAGYVPLPEKLKQRLPAKQEAQSYLCSATPMPGMQVSWTIAGESIYMKQSLEKTETWYGIGFKDAAPFDMSNADFIVTMFNKNYTGIRDMYRYEAGNGYPCWDVLEQCSMNGTKGNQDLQHRYNHRANGMSLSTWDRKLDTGDYKDSPITESTKKVFFAYGKDDFFTYHSKAQHITCDMNFFTGEVACGTSAAAVSAEQFV